MTLLRLDYGTESSGHHPDEARHYNIRSTIPPW